MLFIGFVSLKKLFQLPQNSWKSMVLKMNTHLFPSLFSFYVAISMAKQQVGTPFVFKKVCLEKI